MDDIVKALQESGFVPQVNVDEDFPAFEGEYAVTVKALRPWVNAETGAKEAYMLQLVVAKTLSGDMAEGRVVSRFYRIAGYGFDGNATTPEQAQDNLKRLCNDLFTIGVELNRSTLAGFEESFAKAISAPGYLRCWKSRNRQAPDGPLVQNFRIKREQDLRKGSRAVSAGEAAPF